MLPLAARTGVALVLMHMQGEPRTMQLNPTYRDVVAEVSDFLRDRAAAAEAAGVIRQRILLDVGIGFGKTQEHNLALLRAHARIAALGFPMVLGTSRKGFIGTLTKRPVASERVLGTAATIAWGLTNGADILRVHDVALMREVLDVIVAIRSDRRAD
jgi:dihydropteroate synthase